MNPNPGSDEAVEGGCTCPVLDNEYGHGMMRDEKTFVISGLCPMHKGDFEEVSADAVVANTKAFPHTGVEFDAAKVEVPHFEEFSRWWRKQWPMTSPDRLTIQLYIFFGEVMKRVGRAETGGPRSAESRDEAGEARGSQGQEGG